MSEFAHRSGKPLTCLCMALKVHKEETVDGGGNRVFRIGLRIGGGIDQDYSKSMYNDNGVYITHVEPNSPADRAGVKVHDKILQVNGIDYTMITHNRAVKYLKKYQVLDVLVARPKVLEEDV